MKLDTRANINGNEAGSDRCRIEGVKDSVRTFLTQAARDCYIEYLSVTGPVLSTGK